MPAPLDFGRFQQELSALLDGIEHPRLLSVLALGEEVGEVQRCALDAEGYGKNVKEALAGEVGDVLVALTEVASRYGISLAACAEASLSKIARKAPAWREELSGRLVELRRRYDGV